MTRIDEIKARLEAATPGPWVWRNDKMSVAYNYLPDGNTHKQPTEEELAAGSYFTGDRIIETDSGTYPPEENDRALIANAPSDIAYLLDLLGKAEEALQLSDSCYHCEDNACEALALIRGSD